jgi:hypothetical protein
MAILDEVKGSLRITNTASDIDIADVVSACELDMRLAGVVSIDANDALTRQAIKLYCRAYFNFQGEGVRWQEAYNGLKNSMALCGDYNTVTT